MFQQCSKQWTVPSSSSGFSACLAAEGRASEQAAWPLRSARAAPLRRPNPMLSASTKRTDSATRGLLQESASRTSSASAGDEEDAFASDEPHGPHRWGQPRSMVCIGVLLVAVSSLAWVAVVRDEPHHHHKKHLRRRANSPTTCPDFCSSWTCDQASCAPCGFCDPDAPPCLWWCSWWTRGLTGCQGCQYCNVQGGYCHRGCEPWCNECAPAQNEYANGLDVAPHTTRVTVSRPHPPSRFTCGHAACGECDVCPKTAPPPPPPSPPLAELVPLSDWGTTCTRNADCESQVCGHTCSALDFDPYSSTSCTCPCVAPTLCCCGCILVNNYRPNSSLLSNGVVTA